MRARAVSFLLWVCLHPIDAPCLEEGLQDVVGGVPQGEKVRQLADLGVLTPAAGALQVKVAAEGQGCAAGPSGEMCEFFLCVGGVAKGVV